MSLELNTRALERVCKLLDIDYKRGFGFVILTPDQKNPLGCCTLDHETGVVNIFINSELDRPTANFIALHELRHAAQEIHGRVISSGKYVTAVEAAGFDPQKVCKVDREFEATDEETARYNNIPWEKDANDFARANEDLYEVIVER